MGLSTREWWTSLASSSSPGGIIKGVFVERKATAIDTSETSLEATTVQEAVVELDTKIGDISTLLDQINGSYTSSGGGNA